MVWRQARLRTIQGLDLAFLIPTQHQGMLGRVPIQADDVFQFFCNQIRRTLASLMPTARAMLRVLQCVAFAGFCRVVMFTTRRTTLAVMVGVRPGRGASCCKPTMPKVRKRLRQRDTFLGVTSSRQRCACLAGLRRPTARPGHARPRAPGATGCELAAATLLVV